MAEQATRAARLVEPDGHDTWNVLGPTLQFCTPPDAADDEPCVLRGTIPAGGIVPMHAHRDPETFLMVSGTMESLIVTPEGATWTPIRPGDVMHVPGDVRHAWRNATPEQAVAILVTTQNMGRFFREIGTPGDAVAGPPTDEQIGRFLATAERYGYWTATPEENAAVGLGPPG